VSRFALLTDASFERHETPPRHPESPARNVAVREALAPFTKQAIRIKQRIASEDEIALCHSREYIAIAKRDIHEGHGELSTGDTHVSRASWEVATEAVGGVLGAVDLVCGKQADTAFCAVRPPGHHATPVRGMGFCVFNNIAIGARYAQKKHGLKNVLIVDWDVHHGNGTQDVFYRDGSVMFLSTHQHPWYPGTGMAGERGEGKGEGKILNFPFPAGSGRAEIVNQAFEQHLVKAVDAFKPELIMISAGFDSRAGDPLGHFRLTDNDFRDLTSLLRTLAAKYSGGRVVSVLEGGYSLPGLAAGVTAHVGALAV
jgi:acetoin utilization deacetylase AcuC-like enzyme